MFCALFEQKLNIVSQATWHVQANTAVFTQDSVGVDKLRVIDISLALLLVLQ